MWSHINKEEIEKAIENLLNINLLEIEEDKIALNAFMINFVQDFNPDFIP